MTNQQFKIGDIIVFNGDYFWALIYKIELGTDYGAEEVVVRLFNLKNMSPTSVYLKTTIDKWIKFGFAKIVG